MTIRVVTPSTEFGPQLPPEGGTFYAHEAADGSRPFYKSSWPPLLQATALWLGRTDDDDGDGDDALTEIFGNRVLFFSRPFLLLLFRVQWRQQ